MKSFIPLLDDIRACKICEASLPFGPRPVIQAGEDARILIIGQAPGSKVHASGIPFDDASGDRLRAWMGVNKSTFYDASKIAIMPMGFCYPGKGRSGDLPPRPECAQMWHQQVLNALTKIELTLLVGQYAQKYYLQKSYLQKYAIEKKHTTLTENVKNWQDFLPAFFPVPHPSPRNQIWLKKHPWFETAAVIELQRIVARLV